MNEYLTLSFNRSFRRVLVALLHYGLTDASLSRVLSYQRLPLVPLPLAWLLQFNPQPRHLHHLQPRVSNGLQEDLVRRQPQPAEKTQIETHDLSYTYLQNNCIIHNTSVAVDFDKVFGVK